MTLLLGGCELCLTKDVKAELIEMMTVALEKQKGFELSGSDYEFAEAAICFDACLINVAHNSKLKLFFDRLFDMLFIIVLYNHQNANVDRTANIEEHLEILEAIKTGDDEMVRSFIKNHYARVPNSICY